MSLLCQPNWVSRERERPVGAQPPLAHAPGSPAEAQAAAPRVDRYGDPLPDGAITRIGTSRLVQPATTIAFSPDGRLIATGSESGAASAVVHISEAKTGKLLQILKTDAVRINPASELTFSPDSRLLAVSGFWAKAVVLWDVTTGRLLHQLPNTVDGQERWARWPENPTLAFTPDGRTLIGGGKDGGVYLWDVATGQEKARIKREGDTVIALTISASANMALTAHAGSAREGGDVHLWDLANRRHIRKLDVPRAPRGRGQDAPQMVAIAPDGKTYAHCVNGDEMVVLQTTDDRVLHRIADKQVIVGLAFASDGLLWIARDGGEVTAWDVGSGERRRSIVCPGMDLGQRIPATSPITTTAWFSPDARAVAWRGSSVRIWDLTTGRETPVFVRHNEGTRWVSFTEDGQTLLTAGSRSEIGVWDAATGLDRQPLRFLTPPPPMNRRVRATVYSPSFDRRRVVVVYQGEQAEGSRGGQVISLWEPSAGRPTDPVVVEPAGAAEVVHAILTPDSRFIVVASNDGKSVMSATTDQAGTLRVYDAATRQLVRTIPSRGFESRLAMTPDGSVLASVDNIARSVRLYDFATGRALCDLNVSTQVSGMAMSPDGRLLACGYFDLGDLDRLPGVGPVVILWHVASGRERYRIPVERRTIGREMAFSPDGRLLLRGGIDGTVCLWEIASGQERRSFAGHDRFVNSVDFAPDGRRVASGGQDCTALVWQVFDPAPADLTDAELTAKWNDLAKDAAAAHKAVGALVGAKAAVPFLAQRLAPEAGIPAERLTRLIADLDDPRFATRQEAEKELLGLAEFAAAALRQALANNPTVELRQRADKLLEALDRPITNAEQLRKLRAVEVLEHVGTADARQVLQRLAGGAPDARLTHDAKASLEWLKRRN
jgi:WD40 repeat protein